MALKEDVLSAGIPRITILSEEQKKILFQSVLEVYETTGIQVDNREGLELLRGAGARVGEKNRVHIPAFVVEDALKTAAHSVSLYNRLGEKTVVLEGRRSYFASQVDSTYFFDPFDRVRRRSVRADARLGAVVCDALPHIDLVSFSSLYSDVPAPIALRLGHKDTVTNCTKPIMHGTAELGSLKAIAEMAAVVKGGWDELRQKPYYIHYVEPLSPQVHTDVGVAKLLFCVEHGIPVIYSPMTVGGGSAPVTGAGNLVACMAESLIGVVLAQQIRPGAPVLFGGVPTVIDMTSGMVSYGAPELNLWSAALTEMAHYLGLPVFSTAGCTDAVIFDQQAAVESAMSCLMAALSGANLIHDVGFTESANSASLELIAATDEFIDFIGAMVKGIDVTEESLALKAIDQAGPGGMFLTEEHTMRNFRKNWFPSMMNRQNFDGWAAGGSLSLEEKANRRVRGILEGHQPEPLADDVAAELEKMEKSWLKEVS